MKRPWQIWLLLAATVAAVVPAMAWLTYKAVELDRAESVARQQAVLEEDISRALWRLDALLTPLLAQEAARPDFVYRSLYETSAPSGKGQATKAISPLLLQPPDFVLVHFELHPDGRMTSPQCPSGADQQWALDNGAPSNKISQAELSLRELRGQLSHASLLAQLPDESLPDTIVPLAGFATNATLIAENNPLVVANTYGLPTPELDQRSGQQRPLQQRDEQFSQQQGVASDFSANGEVEAAQLPYSQQAAQPTAQQAVQSPFADESQAATPAPQRSQTRRGKDLVNRDAAYQAYAQKAVVEQRQNFQQIVQSERVIEGISRPLWIDGRLVLARRVQSGRITLIQGCWLDWEKLQRRMHEEVADLLPAAVLAPVTEDEPPRHARLLATLPVQLSTPSPQPIVPMFSPMRLSLLVAWACLLLAAIAGGWTLLSIVALSERRAAFVAAVTHELRTPLTTFRMYAEMLAEGMVPDATQRQRYLETLRVEADRLHHLVDNVLQYARLERGRPGKRREPIELGALVDQIDSRLADRAAQADMKLVVELSDEDRQTVLPVDVAAVDQILFNLVDNACKYAAGASDRRIHLQAETTRDGVCLRVGDHGPGISKQGRRKLFQPFSKSVNEAADTAPGVGLGLALCQRLARDLGGSLALVTGDEGATFELRLPRG